MKRAVLLVALSALLCVGATSVLLGPLSSGKLARGAALVVFLLALLLAVTAGILSYVTALRQQRLVRSVALAIMTQVGLVSASITLPTIMALPFGGAPPNGNALSVPDIAVAFAPPVVLPLAALGSLLLARSRHGAPNGRSRATDAAVPTTPVTDQRQPPQWLALVSVVVVLSGPVAVPLALLLHQLAPYASPGSPPLCQLGIGDCSPGGGSLVSSLLMVLSMGLLIVSLPAVGVAIVSAHVALSRLRHHAAPTFQRTVAVWTLILEYGTFPVLMAYYVWAVVLSSLGE